MELKIDSLTWQLVAHITYELLSCQSGQWTVDTQPSLESEKMLVLLTLLSLAVTCSRSLSLPSQTVMPSSVIFTGKTKKIKVAEDELNRKFRCRRFSKNKVKFYQMQNILKSYGSKIKKIHKQLNQMLWFNNKYKVINSFTHSITYLF